MNEFMTAEMLGTFAGLVGAVSIVIQAFKPIVKRKYADGMVRVYTFIVSLIFTFVFARTGQGIQGILLTFVNSIIVALAAMGGYELIADPKAEKERLDI